MHTFLVITRIYVVVSIANLSPSQHIYIYASTRASHNQWLEPRPGILLLL